MDTLADLQRAPGSSVPQAPATLPLALTRTRTFDTPEFRGMRFAEVRVKSALNKVRGMGFDWSLNPYRGCSHACTYCFARPTHAYLNLSPWEDFERTIVVKVNLVEVLRHELSKPSWRGEHVAMGTNTDPYQRCEGRYRLMPEIIGELARARTPLSILTKATLITRDLSVLQSAAALVPVSAALSIATLDERVWRETEPGTPPPRARLEAVAALNAAGIPTGVMAAPIIPGLSDGEDQLAALVDAAVAAGASHVTPITLHLRPGVRELFEPWLRRHHPELTERYAELYGGRANAPAAYRRRVSALVASMRARAWRRHGRPPARRDAGRRRQGGDDRHQNPQRVAPDAPSATAPPAPRQPRLFA